MAECDIWNGFAQRTEDFARSVFNKPSAPTVLRDALPKGVFDKGAGLTKTYFRFANIEPEDSTPTWSPITTAAQGNAGGSCAVDYTQYEGGWDAGTYGPVQIGSKFEVLCRDDQYFNYMPEVWLQQYMVRLSKLSKRILDNYLIDQYMRVVPIGVATLTGFHLIAASSTLTAPQATSELTQDMLDVVAQELIQAGATEPDSNGWIMLNGSMLYWTLLIGMEASKLIQTNNSEFRQDVRFAFEGMGDKNPLMRIVGSDIAIKNFRHHIWLTPPRFSYDGTSYSQVNVYANVSATKGVKPVFSNDYKNADYEGAFVLSPYVMTQEFIEPAASVGGVSWPATDVGMGTWQFVTGKDAGCDNDPLHKRGRHYSEWKLALAPGALPESGTFLVYKRCKNLPLGVSCS